MPTIEGATGSPLQYAGTPTNGTSEQQTITVTGSPSGGTYRLKFGGFVTATIAHSAASSAVQTALRALSSIGSSGCSVSGDGPHVVTFTGDLGKLAVSELISLHANSLTGGTDPSVSITETLAGVTATQRGAAVGAVLVDTTTGNQYANDGTPNAPDWVLIGEQGDTALTTQVDGLAAILLDSAGDPIGDDATIVIPDVGTITVVNGIITDFTPA